MGKVLKIIGASCVVWVVGCSPRPTEQQLSDHQKDVDAWHAKRIEDLKGHDGWLNLAGLFWLEEGINSFIFSPGVEEFFSVRGNVVTMMIPGKGEKVIYHPDSTKAIVNRAGSLEWFIIRRSDKFGIRLRDLES